MSHVAFANAGVTLAPSLDEPCSLLRMAVADEVLAVPIEDVREILQMTRLTPMPRTPAFVRGVMNLRGSVVPVIDLAVRLGLRATELGRRSCIVVVQANPPQESLDTEHPAPLVMGLLVDAVFEVFDRHRTDVEAAPALGTRIPPGFLRGVTRADGQLIGVLALTAVLSAAELADAIERHLPPHPH